MKVAADLEEEDKPTDEDHNLKKSKEKKAANGDFDMANFMYTKQPTTP